MLLLYNAHWIEHENLHSSNISGVCCGEHFDKETFWVNGKESMMMHKPHWRKDVWGSWVCE